MRRAILLAIVLCFIAAPAHADPTPDRWHGKCSGWWMGEYLTPAKWQANPDRGRQMMQRLIVCEFGINAPGQSVYALYVADRESNFYPWAQNPSSLCSGIFQHQLSAWPFRAEVYLDRWEYSRWPVSVFDPRANIEVAAKMVAAGGWSPWQ